MCKSFDTGASQHWITVSNLHSKGGEVICYDSPISTARSSDVQMQVASIIMAKPKSFDITMVDCQQQSGVHDCGLFAIAFATSLCFGKDPTHIQYDQGKMREHLSNSISQKKMSEFPTSGERKPKNIMMKDVNKVNVYCTCRLPDNTEERMIECLVCLEWFHHTCLSLPTPLFKEPAKHKNWMCSECKEKRL